MFPFGKTQAAEPVAVFLQNYQRGLMIGRTSQYELKSLRNNNPAGVHTSHAALVVHYSFRRQPELQGSRLYNAAMAASSLPVSIGCWGMD